MFGWVDVYSGYDEMIKISNKSCVPDCIALCLQYCKSKGVECKRLHFDNEAVFHSPAAKEATITKYAPMGGLQSQQRGGPGHSGASMSVFDTVARDPPRFAARPGQILCYLGCYVQVVPWTMQRAPTCTQASLIYHLCCICTAYRLHTSMYPFPAAPVVGR